MAIPTYTPGYPPDGSSLGQTKSVIRNNLDGTFQTLNVDHVNNNGQPGTNPAGYHTIIHEVTQTSATTVTGVNQVFSGVPGSLTVDAVTTPAIPTGGDTQLYSLSGGGVLSQLTGGSLNTTGYAWAGGMLFQWGTVSYSSAGAPQGFSFSKTFPNKGFVVTIQSQSNHSAAFAQANLTGPNGTNGFQIVSNSNPGFSVNYYYIAIGY